MSWLPDLRSTRTVPVYLRQDEADGCVSRIKEDVSSFVDLLFIVIVDEACDVSGLYACHVRCNETSGLRRRSFHSLHACNYAYVTVRVRYQVPGTGGAERGRRADKYICTRYAYPGTKAPYQVRYPPGSTQTPHTTGVGPHSTRYLVPGTVLYVRYLPVLDILQVRPFLYCKH